MIDPSYVNIYRKSDSSLRPVDYINDAQHLMIYTNSLDISYVPPLLSNINDSSYEIIHTNITNIPQINHKFVNDSKILTTYSNSIQIPGISYRTPPEL